VTGTTLRKAAWIRAEKVGSRSHGSARSPRQCSLHALDCDSCCRGFESHQPPQYSCGFQAEMLVARTGRNSHRGNTRRPDGSPRRRYCIGEWISRPTALTSFPYCTKIQLVNVRDHEDNRARGPTHAFQAPQTGTVVPHWKRSSRASAFQRRCFVVGVKLGGRTPETCPVQIRVGVDAAGTQVDYVGSIPTAHPKASSSSGRELTQHMGLYGPHPRNTSSGDQPRADPALVERLEQGVCVSGDRSRTLRGTLSLMALGLVQHRGWQMEKVAHQSPCRSFARYPQQD
jgi:hypothetical protein